MSTPENSLASPSAPRNSSSPRRNKLLCIAYAFPPILRSGTHRTLGFIRELDALGWDTTVLTVEPKDELLDESLLERIPASTRIVRTPWVDTIQWVKSMGGLKEISATNGTAPGSRNGATHKTEPFDPLLFSDKETPRSLRDWISRWLMTPDSRVGWIKPAVRAGCQIVQQIQPDAIYSTSPYMSAHLIALKIKKQCQLPWVADFRDPWRGNPFRNLVYRSVNWWDDRCEQRVLREADRIVCCTPTMTDQLRRRRPFVANKCTTILNAFDPDALDTIEPRRILPRSRVILTHCGNFYGPRSPTVWFRALKLLRERSPEEAEKLLFLQMGDDSYRGKPIMEWAKAYDVQKMVKVIKPQSHRDMLALLKGSDALVLSAASGTGAELQIPNKLYEYLMVKKPILATCVKASPIRDILEDARAEAYVCESEDAYAVAFSMMRIARWERSIPEFPWSGVDRYARRYRAIELAGVLESLGITSKSQTAPTTQETAVSQPELVCTP